MVRTQVYLTDKQKTAIAVLATRRNIGEAELIRELIDAGLAAQTQATPPATALLELVQLGQRLGVSGPADLSARHDDALSRDEDGP